MLSAWVAYCPGAVFRRDAPGALGSLRDFGNREGSGPSWVPDSAGRVHSGVYSAGSLSSWTPPDRYGTLRERHNRESPCCCLPLPEVFGFVKKNLSGAQRRKSAASGERYRGGSPCPRPALERPGARPALRIAVDWIDQHYGVSGGLSKSATSKSAVWRFAS